MDAESQDNSYLSESVDRPTRDERFAELFGQHRERLCFMVSMRLDPQLQRRVDASDVLQEVYVEAARRLDQYLEAPPATLFLWLRRLTGQRLIDLHRFHLGARGRSARQEIHGKQEDSPDASAVQMVALVAADQTSPSEAAVRRERQQHVYEALDAMELIDREILSLRNFEHLSNVEAARVLGIDESTSSKRYIRALERLKKSLAAES